MGELNKRLKKLLLLPKWAIGLWTSYPNGLLSNVFISLELPHRNSVSIFRGSKMFNNSLNKAFFAVALIAAASSANASTYNYNSTLKYYSAPKQTTCTSNCTNPNSNTQLKFSSVNKTVNTNVTIGGSAYSGKTVALGSYNLIEKPSTTSSTTKALVGFCVDPYQTAVSSFTGYTKSTFDASDFITTNALYSHVQRFTFAQKLFDNAYATLSTAISGVSYGTTSVVNANTAGFHLALWEIFFDDLDTTKGGILKTSTTNTAVLGAANSFLSQLTSWTVKDKYALTFFKSICDQDFLVAELKQTPPKTVPVPAALPLILSGLVGLGLVRRRRTL